VQATHDRSHAGVERERIQAVAAGGAGVEVGRQRLDDGVPIEAGSEGRDRLIGIGDSGRRRLRQPRVAARWLLREAFRGDRLGRIAVRQRRARHATRQLDGAMPS
jgi:hypothetical protein